MNTRRALLGLLACSCAARAPASRAIVFDPIRIQVASGDAPELTIAFDAQALLDEGTDALMQRHYDDALLAYDRLLIDFPTSPLSRAALYDSGLALEGKGELGAAIARYGKLAAIEETNPIDPRAAVQTRLRLASVLSDARRFGAAEEVLRALLETMELTAAEALEALAKLGHALVERADYVRAEDVLGRAISHHKGAQATEQVDDYFAAMSQYYLGDIPRRQFVAIALHLPKEELERDVEAKSELFLVARDRFIRTAYYKSPYWATAAIFTLATMYMDFWYAFMAVPIPPELRPLEVEAYVKLVNESQDLRKLLEKSVAYHERNVEIARNRQITTMWSEASDAAARHAKRLLEKQAGGDVFLPGKVPPRDERLKLTPSASRDNIPRVAPTSSP